MGQVFTVVFVMTVTQEMTAPRLHSFAQATVPVADFVTATVSVFVNLVTMELLVKMFKQHAPNSTTVPGMVTASTTPASALPVLPVKPALLLVTLEEATAQLDVMHQQEAGAWQVPPTQLLAVFVSLSMMVLVVS